MRRFATVVKARPTDVVSETFRVMRDWFGLVRFFLGVENASAQGLRTLRRGVRREENHRAMRTLRDLGIYCCFNLLLFDPDTTLESLEENLAFLEEHADTPCNFGRVELYAGTPLLARMQAEVGAQGLHGLELRAADRGGGRVFQLAMLYFHPRNFETGPREPPHKHALQRRDHPTLPPSRLRSALARPRAGLSRRLGRDSVAGMRALVRVVRQGNRRRRRMPPPP
jgi:hypothetical protein